MLRKLLLKIKGKVSAVNQEWFTARDSGEGEEPVVPSFMQNLEFNAFFCFFTFERSPKLIHSGHKGMKFTEAEVRALILASQAEVNESQSINIISDYMMAVQKMPEDKQLLIQLRAAGWDALLSALLSTYAVELISCFDNNSRSEIQTVDVYFMIRPGGHDMKNFANSCFSLNFAAAGQPDDAKLTLKDVVDSYVARVSA